MRLFWRRPKPNRLEAGNRAMAARQWVDAAAHYAAVLAEQPDNGAIWVQYGHACKEMGALDRAGEGYAAAIASDPSDIDARLHRAHLLRRLGSDEASIDEFATIVAIDPAHHEARTMLIESGARHRLPNEAQRAGTAIDLTALREQLIDLGRRVDRWIDGATYPTTNYNGFRHDFPITPPPATVLPLPTIHIEIDARDSAPYFLRATLISLIDQSDDGWSATVIADDETAAHPVASLGADPRICFAVEPVSSDYVLRISAGTVLDVQALRWFKFTLHRTRAAAAWCDSDRATEHWRDRRTYEQPDLWGVFDIDLMAQTSSPPAAVAVQSSAVVDPSKVAAEARRSALIDASCAGPVAHIPRILATVLRAPDHARQAPQGDELDRPEQSPPEPGAVAGTPIILAAHDGRFVSVGSTQPQDSRIQLIIPTRDAAAMLDAACSSLLSKATAAGRIDLTIIDNHSEQSETAQLLTRLAERPNVTVLPLDEPFNWSRANNIGLRASSAGMVVFANNDVEMLTQGWDDLLSGYLARTDIGAVGARLLYPDESVQHGGMLLGLGDGLPIHDGIGVARDVTGPQERYVLTHSTAAVTGAFLAARRDTVERIGGFDEVGLAMAYNDIDFCLNMRSIGLKILYAPAIELIHHESKTRGHNDTGVKIAWDLGELRTLYQRWGESMLIDPGYNPHWSADRAHDGFRSPTLTQILQHIEISVQPNPWHASRVTAAPVDFVR